MPLSSFVKPVGFLVIYMLVVKRYFYTQVWFTVACFDSGVEGVHGIYWIGRNCVQIYTLCIFSFAPCFQRRVTSLLCGLAYVHIYTIRPLAF